MSTKKKSCGKCRYAGKFWLTPKGRFKRDTTANCGYLVEIGPRPESVVSVEVRKYAIRPNDGEQCPVYEEKP